MSRYRVVVKITVTELDRVKPESVDHDIEVLRVFKTYAMAKKFIAAITAVF